MPGFNDAHTHLASAGFGRMNVDLTGTHSLQEVQARIAERVKSAQPGEWIRGRGWDHTVWPGGKLPTRQDLDAVTGKRVTFAAFPWRWVGGDGCIVRLVAITDPSGEYRLEPGS